jgi:hypothetical protein
MVILGVEKTELFRTEVVCLLARKRLTSMIFYRSRSGDMNSPSASTPLTGSYGGQKQAKTQMHGRWLIFAWIAWLALVIPPMVVFLTGLPGYREMVYQSNLIYASSFQHIGITVDF